MSARPSRSRSPSTRRCGATSVGEWTGAENVPSPLPGKHDDIAAAGNDVCNSVAADIADREADRERAEKRRRKCGADVDRTDAAEGSARATEDDTDRAGAGRADDEVGAAIAVEVGDPGDVVAETDGVRHRRLERPVAVTKQGADHGGAAVTENHVLPSVAVEVAGLEAQWLAHAARPRRPRREGAIAVAEQDFEFPGRRRSRGRSRHRR